MIATGFNTCDYIYDSSVSGAVASQRAKTLLQKLEEFVVKDEKLSKEESVNGIGPSLLSGSLSMALCCILTRNGICFLSLDHFNLLCEIIGLI